MTPALLPPVPHSCYPFWLECSIRQYAKSCLVSVNVFAIGFAIHLGSIWGCARLVSTQRLEVPAANEDTARPNRQCFEVQSRRLNRNSVCFRQRLIGSARDCASEGRIYSECRAAESNPGQTEQISLHVWWVWWKVRKPNAGLAKVHHETTIHDIDGGVWRQERLTRVPIHSTVHLTQFGRMLLRGPRPDQGRYATVTRASR